MVVTPIYRHNSPDTAFLVPDYPYGRKTRCRIRYWLEYDAKRGLRRGFRFCAQTEHPTKLVWNAPKKSTYAPLAGCMYLDEKGHVQWAAVSEYDDHTRLLEFVTSFPRAQLAYLYRLVLGRIRLYDQLLAGKAVWTINGEAKPETEAEQERNRAQLAGYTAVRDAMIALCGCTRGSTCTEAHEPAACGCHQCFPPVAT